MRRGQICLCDFGSPIGHEAGFRRPAVVLSPEALNRHGLLIVLPVTRSRHDYPTHVELEDVLPVTSYVQCELIRSISAERVIRTVGALDPVDLARIEVVIRRLLDLPTTPG